jgi:GDPmannose 4,6-dehydratase
VRRFVELAFLHVGIPIRWEGIGVNEKGMHDKTDQVLVAVDPRYFRPTEVDLLIGDPSKANNILGWKAKTTFETLVSDMMQSDLELVKREAEYRRVDEERGRL